MKSSIGSVLVLALAGCATGGGAGRPAAEFNLPALDGGQLSSASLSGHVAVVDFWASWCVPCRAELPELEKLRQAWAPRGVLFVTINIDNDRAEAERMVKQLGVSMPVGLDPEKHTASAFDVPTMPSSFVLDRQGRVRYAHEGWNGDADVARFRAELDELLR
jgi:thiol-disulfide isomerase/thioredoxin